MRYLFEPKPFDLPKPGDLIAFTPLDGPTQHLIVSGSRSDGYTQHWQVIPDPFETSA
jgi:hypothetical protein